jgi:hypothetical protein
MDELLEAIESHRFSAMVNLASDYDHFVQAVVSMPEYKRLSSEVQDRNSAWRVFLRMVQISTSEFDPDFENPWDAALAAYLLLLNSTSHVLGAVAAEVALTCPNCFWARKLATRIKASLRASSASYDVYRLISERSPAALQARHTLQSQRLIITSDSIYPQPAKSIPVPAGYFVWLGAAQDPEFVNVFKNRESSSRTQRTVEVSS